MDPRAQELNEGKQVGEPYAGLVRTRHRQVGGTVNTWNVEVDHAIGAKYVPLSHRDLAAWPIEWSDLEPWYREAQEICGLGPFEYDADPWAVPGRTPFHLEGTGLTSGVYQFGPARRFTHELVGRLKAMETVTLMPSCTAVELLRDGSGQRLRGVRIVDHGGELVDVDADVVVLACGAVENARLLLLAGLGHELPWLGRGFMEHARDFSLTLVPQSSRLFSQASFYDFHQSVEGHWIGGRLAPTEDALDRYDLPNASMTLVPRPRAANTSLPARMVRRVQRMAGRKRRRSRYGWSSLAAPETSFDAFEIVLNLEHRSRPEHRIELGTRRDRFGNALPRLAFHWTEAEQERLERFRGLLDQWFRAAGLGHVEGEQGRRPNLSAHHHAGTTRMGASADEAVVGKEGGVFGVDNLYVAGASVFPSAGYANPTLTIVAMALRLAAHLDASLG
jgi:choline dehydrogenase-like flavoprotein